jgi:hypothetical protein
LPRISIGAKSKTPPEWEHRRGQLKKKVDLSEFYSGGPFVAKPLTHDQQAAIDSAAACSSSYRLCLSSATASFTAFAQRTSDRCSSRLPTISDTTSRDA